MTDHPITPPPELAQQWMTNFYGTPIVPGEACTDLAARAAQWGADQELEACCEWLIGWDTCEGERLASLLHEGRRPKPPSLKEEALGGLDQLAVRLTEAGVAVDLDTIRRALEALPND